MATIVPGVLSPDIFVFLAGSADATNNDEWHSGRRPQIAVDALSSVAINFCRASVERAAYVAMHRTVNHSRPHHSTNGPHKNHQRRAYNGNRWHNHHHHHHHKPHVSVNRKEQNKNKFYYKRSTENEVRKVQRGANTESASKPNQSISAQYELNSKLDQNKELH